MKPGYIVGGVVILLCVMVTAMALSGSVRRTVTFAEARASQEPCEIYGEVVKNSMKANLAAGSFTFQIQEAKTDEVMTVLSSKPKPSNFDQASHVKAIGTFAGSAFAAHDLLIKCPSKYQGVPKKQEADLSGAGMAGITLTLGLLAFETVRRMGRA